MKYLGISSKTIMQRLEELQEYKDEMKVREDNYKQTLDEIETLLQDALDTEKTDTQESFDNFYKCLDIIKGR